MEFFERFTTLQLVFIALAGITWVGGGNVLHFLHWRRQRRLGAPRLPLWRILLGFNGNPFRNYSAMEFRILFFLGLLTFFFAIIALVVVAPADQNLPLNALENGG